MRPNLRLPVQTIARAMSTSSVPPTKLIPPFTAETANAKVKVAQNLWNGQNPEKIALAYTEGSFPFYIHL